MKIIKSEAYLENYGAQTLDSILVKGQVWKEEKQNALFINVDCECQFEPYDYTRVFQRYGSVVITAEVNDVEKILAQRIKSPFWAGPEFAEDFTAIPDRTQVLLLKCKDTCKFIYALANENFQTTFRSSKEKNRFEISINKISPDTTKAEGTSLIMTEDKDPYEAIRKGFEVLESEKLIRTRLKKHKKYPETLNYLGWCTWNAFYHDVTHDGIIGKMEEFKTKGIPVRWVLIDDGWSEYNEDMTLRTIYEDKTKFPGGLKETVKVLKEKYGVLSVGAWHSATGYWKGTQFKDETTLSTPQGIEVPAGYEFYSKWHTYLKEQGIDFVKVDCQGNIWEYMHNNPGSLAVIIKTQQGLDKAARENFEFMINCMGMVNINMLNRDDSVMCRNSDDFFPLEKEKLENHVMQNSYNALFNDHLYFCDFDMWWSEHFQAAQNAVLRAISGGPFYLSDKLDGSSAEVIRDFVDKNGRINRYDHAAKPTPDCVFGIDKVLKIFNNRGEDGAVATFTFKEGGKCTVSAADFGGKGAYKVKEKLTGEEFILPAGESFECVMDEHTVKMYEFTKEV